MIKLFPGEEWTQLPINGKGGLKYAISNYGRVISYTKLITDGNLLKGSFNRGYKTLKTSQIQDGEKVSKTYYIHRLVAEHFLPQKREDQKFVIHLDYVRDNNQYKNLRWASREEVEEHQSKNPKVIEDRKRLRKHNQLNEYKLTEEKVRILKRKLFKPGRKTRIKMLARQFGISEMQVYRIQIGENWGHVQI